MTIFQKYCQAVVFLGTLLWLFDAFSGCLHLAGIVFQFPYGKWPARVSVGGMLLMFILSIMVSHAVAYRIRRDPRIFDQLLTILPSAVKLMMSSFFMFAVSFAMASPGHEPPMGWLFLPFIAFSVAVHKVARKTL